jgi:membrane associated rhomboid family serine protease
MHILFNMYALISFGPLVEHVMGAKRFLSFYLFCGLFGTTVTALFDPSPFPVLGASGALFGVLVAFAYYYPNQRIGIMFLPFQFRVRPFILVICAISALLVIADVVGMTIGRGISHFGHLAGAAGAAVLLFGGNIPKLLKRNRN